MGVCVHVCWRVKAYYRGAAMRAANVGGNSSVFGGFLPIPTAGPTGICIDTNFGHFQEPVRDNNCFRAANDCHELDAKRFAEIMYYQMTSVIRVFYCDTFSWW